MCFKVTMKLTCLVVCFVYVQLSSAGSNHISGGFVKNNLENFKSCALNVNLTCLEMLVRSKIYELNHANEIRVLDNVVIEKLDSAGDTSLYQQRAVGKDWMRDVTHFISNRALKVNLWDMINMRLSKSLQNPENVQVSFGLTPDIERLGKKIKRSHNIARVVVPLILGFLLTGKLILGLAFVKALLMKAFVVSNIAFLGVAYILVKKFFKSQNNAYQFLHTPSIPYHSSMPSGYGASAYGYAMPYTSGIGHYATIQPSHHQAWTPTHAEYDAGAAVVGAPEDSQGHYSHHLAQTANVTAAKMRRKFGYGGMVGMVKSHRSPVLAYRQASLGRSV